MFDVFKKKFIPYKYCYTAADRYAEAYKWVNRNVQNNELLEKDYKLFREVYDIVTNIVTDVGPGANDDLLKLVSIIEKLYTKSKQQEKLYLDVIMKNMTSKS